MALPRHVAIFKGQSQYGSLRTHVDQLSAALRALGVRVTCLDFLEDGLIARLTQTLTDPVPPELFLSFNGVGADLRAGERTICDMIGIDHLSFMVDHPIYQWERLKSSREGRILPCFIDRSHVRYVGRMLEPERFPLLGFLPPGASTAGPSAEPPPFSWGPERDIPVLFTGTFRGIPARSWPQDGALASRVIDGTVDRVLAGDGCAAHEAMDEVLGELGLEPTRARHAALTAALHVALDHCAAVHRHRVITALCDAGVPLVVYGKGWGPLAERHPNLDWRGEGSWEETLALLPRTRIVLSTNNEFFEGAHERVFAAQAHGAAVVSETSSEYARMFRDDEDLLLYRWSEVETLGERVRDALADDARLSTLAASGHAVTRAHHTWRHRAEEALRLWRGARTPRA